MTCLGCGGIVCQVCEDKSNALTKLSHWPLEVSVSRAALAEIETAIRERDVPWATAALDAELENLANIIRAHLQHPAAPALPGRSEVEEDWLA